MLPCVIATTCITLETCRKCGVLLEGNEETLRHFRFSVFKLAKASQYERIHKACDRLQDTIKQLMGYENLRTYPSTRFRWLKDDMVFDSCVFATMIAFCVVALGSMSCRASTRMSRVPCRPQEYLILDFTLSQGQDRITNTSCRPLDGIRFLSEGP